MNLPHTPLAFKTVSLCDDVDPDPAEYQCRCRCVYDGLTWILDVSRYDPFKCFIAASASSDPAKPMKPNFRNFPDFEYFKLQSVTAPYFSNKVLIRSSLVYN